MNDHINPDENFHEKYISIKTFYPVFLKNSKKICYFFTAADSLNFRKTFLDCKIAATKIQAIYYNL